jgi:DNA-binding MurR/RpiR family transcriptional regulator
MSATPQLVRLIEEHAAALSPAQQRLARHVLANWRGLAFATVAELARGAEVSDATVVRFAHALGFAGYPGLQKEARRLLRADLKGTDRLRLATARPEAGATPLQRAIRAELDNIAQLEAQHDAAALPAAARLLRRARRVLVVGARASAPLAFHLWFGLDKLGLEASRSLAADSEAADRLGRMDAADAVVVIGFPRYLHALTGLLSLAEQRGVRRLVVTDSPFSALKGEIALYAPAESASFTAFHAAPLILLNALIEEVVALDRPAALRALQGFEAVAEAQGYFRPIA